MKYKYTYKISYISENNGRSRYDEINDKCSYELTCDMDQEAIDAHCRKLHVLFVSAELVSTAENDKPKKQWWLQTGGILSSILKRIRKLYATKKLKDATQTISSIINMGCNATHKRLELIELVSGLILTHIGDNPEVYVQPVSRISNSVKRIVAEMKLVSNEVRQSIGQNKRQFQWLEAAIKEALNEHDTTINDLNEKGVAEIEKLTNMFT